MFYRSVASIIKNFYGLLVFLRVNSTKIAAIYIGDENVL